MASKTVVGGDVVAKNMIIFGNRFLDEVNKDMEKISKIVFAKVRQNAGLTDHSLRDLADLGHPYSRNAFRSLHQPDYKVHSQSGELFRGIYREVEKASSLGGRLTAAAVVGIRESVDHAIHVIVGTSRMVPRDFLIGSLKEKQAASMDILKRSLKGTVIKFAGRKVIF